MRDQVNHNSTRLTLCASRQILGNRSHPDPDSQHSQLALSPESHPARLYISVSRSR